jgi:hypothetical protein
MREITERVFRKVPLLLIPLAAAMLTACSTVGPPVLERAVLGYDETDAQLSQQMVLLNIARWRAGESPHLTVTSSIAATFDWTARSGLGAQFEDSSGTDFFNIDLGASASENPTFSILPVKGQDYIERVIEPLDEDAFYVIAHQDYFAFDRLLRLLASGIEVHGPKGGLQRFIANSPQWAEEYIEFRRIALHLHWLAENRKLFIQPLIFEDMLFKDIADRPKAEDLAKGINLGVTWRQKPDGRFQASKLTKGRVVITNYDPRDLSDEERWALNERIKRQSTSLVYLEIAPGYPGGDYPIRGGVRLRSFAGIIKFIAEGMEEFPEFDVEQDPRTATSGLATDNPAATLAIEITESAPPNQVPAVQYRGEYYGVADTKWDRRNFRIIGLLNQATVGDVEGIGIPVTISK